MKTGVVFFGLALLGILMACGDGNVLVTPDPAVQLETDSVIIAEYFEEKNITDYETSDGGVRYVILEEGDGEAIDESDIVSFLYNGMLLNDSIFDTNNQMVGDSIRNHFLEDSVGMTDKSIYDIYLATFTEDREYEPFIITYTASGWAISERFIIGFTEGVSETFNQMNIGGKSLIVIPSALGYGGNGSGFLIPPNTVIAFELTPTSVTKQGRK